MARARRHGTWSKVHESIDDHPKTKAAAAVLVAELGLEEDLAAAVVVRAVRRMVCWAIRESDSGATGHLDDAQVVSTGWPAAMRPGGRLWGVQDVGVLRRALRAVPEGYQVGFLYDRGRRQGVKGVEALHEFHAYAWAVLKDRPHYQGTKLEDHLEGAKPGRGPREVEERPARSEAELDGEAGARRGPNLLPANDPPRAEGARPTRAIGIGSGTGTEGSEGFGGGSPRAAADVLDPLADPAELIRSLRPSRHAGLLEGSIYVQRLAQTAERVQGAIPAVYQLAQLSTPGRALEELEPEAFEALVLALREAGEVRKPTAYASKALAQRWDEVIGRRADQAQRRRERRAQARRSG